MRRLLGTCLAVGLTLFYARAASAQPQVELTTALGGADASEYLVRVANPEAQEESGVIELRRGRNGRADDAPAMARTTFSVPGHETRYFRLPGEKGQQFEAVAITSRGTYHAQQRFNGGGSLVVFDIPPQDAQRLHELRVHSGGTIVMTHAVFDETTQAPLLTTRAAVYDGIALVMVPARVFVGLPAPEREALTTWVRAGGSIALSVNNNDFSHITDLVGVKGERLRPAELGSSAELGLGHVYVLPLDPWTASENGNLAVQEKLASLVEHQHTSSHMFGEPWIDNTPVPSLDPNRGYRSVLPIAGLLLVAQALVSAFAFRRLAVRRGMGPAYRFVALSSAATFAAVIGLGIYAKGGFSARAREISFVDVASGESVAWVERRRTYFSSHTQSFSAKPRDAANDLYARDSRGVLHIDEARKSVILDDLEVRPWETTGVAERGTTTLGSGVTLAFAGNGSVIVRNASGNVLHNVVVSRPNGTCLAFGEIADGAEKTSATPQSCTELGPAWHDYETVVRVEQYLTPYRLVLLGQIEEEPMSLGDFKLEKRTTVLRVTGGDS